MEMREGAGVARGGGWGDGSGQRGKISGVTKQSSVRPHEDLGSLKNRFLNM